jgi:hypothetical protein
MRPQQLSENRPQSRFASGTMPRLSQNKDEGQVMRRRFCDKLCDRGFC